MYDQLLVNSMYREVKYSSPFLFSLRLCTSINFLFLNRARKNPAKTEH